MSYPYREIEKKWQKSWADKKQFHVAEEPDKKKYYVLEMFPYPSGRLHMGHLRVYCIGDVLAHFYRMNGYNVLHPMGFDAFGLPAENAAIENKIHPAEWTYKNIDSVRDQLLAMGISYDWSREITTCDEDYYRWTQWLFLKFFEQGLVYRKRDAVNWCETCATVLANEQVEDGNCWRCSTRVTQKEVDAWYFRITDYAQALLDDIRLLEPGWPERILLMQKNWIGRSEGVEIFFRLAGGEQVPVFTTRVDTIFGATYLVMAPEHPLVEKIKKMPGARTKEIDSFVEKVRKIDKTLRTALELEKEGVFTGITAVNPVNNEKIPVWLGNYVLLEYGTGAIMAVPTHDQRDFLFAKKYGLGLRVVIQPQGQSLKEEKMASAYEGDGTQVNSGQFDGLPNRQAMEKIAGWMEKTGIGKRQVNFRLRDWSISRQRFWGEPIPMIHCKKCGIVPVPEKDLPVRLPKEMRFDLKGISPLASAPEFYKVECPKCKSQATRETDTMDCFVASSWYFARYVSPGEKKLPFTRKAADYWLPVDQYIGGPEHACKHLIYARFFEKVMKKIGLMASDEPFSRLLTQGIVYKDGFKMSKSKGNVVSPDELIDKYGADTARLFILFAAPPEVDLEWNDQGVEGCSRFLNRIWKMLDRKEQGKAPDAEKTELKRITHLTVKRVTNDIGREFHFNTAISAMMELTNAMVVFPATEIPEYRDAMEKLLVLLAPFAPHICEELWQKTGHNESILKQKWPSYEESALVQSEMLIVVQVNGRLRHRINVPAEWSEDRVKEKVMSEEKLKPYLEKAQVRQVVYVPKKLVNIVTS